jgi:hypothetical protein
MISQIPCGTEGLDQFARRQLIGGRAYVVDTGQDAGPGRRGYGGKGPLIKLLGSPGRWMGLD